MTCLVSWATLLALWGALRSSGRFLIHKDAVVINRRPWYRTPACTWNKHMCPRLRVTGCAFGQHLEDAVWEHRAQVERAMRVKGESFHVTASDMVRAVIQDAAGMWLHLTWWDRWCGMQQACDCISASDMVREMQRDAVGGFVSTTQQALSSLKYFQHPKGNLYFSCSSFLPLTLPLEVTLLLSVSINGIVYNHCLCNVTLLTY